jgi:hypothetical protein
MLQLNGLTVKVVGGTTKGPPRIATTNKRNIANTPVRRQLCTRNVLPMLAALEGEYCLFSWYNHTTSAFCRGMQSSALSAERMSRSCAKGRRVHSVAGSFCRKLSGMRTSESLQHHAFHRLVAKERQARTMTVLSISSTHVIMTQVTRSLSTCAAF